MDTFAQWKKILSNHGYRSRVHIFGIVLFLLKFLFLKISTNFIYSYSKIWEERKVIYAWTYNVRFVYHFERGTVTEYGASCRCFTFTCFKAENLTLPKEVLLFVILKKKDSDSDTREAVPVKPKSVQLNASILVDYCFIFTHTYSIHQAW